MNTYKIYKWTNLITSKGYVGQTCMPIHIRAGGRHMNGYRGCKEFWKAIQEYGTDCWQVEILREGLTAEEADIYEDVEIKNHGTLIPNGYNVREGGQKGKSRKSLELQENAEAICESFLKGVSVKEIANRFGSTHPTIIRILRENDINGDVRKKRLDGDEIGYICKVYREGMPIKEIVRKTRCSQSVIYRVLDEKGVLRRNLRLDASEHTKYICESYRAGMPLKEIVDRVKYSSYIIYKILHENNVLTNRRFKRYRRQQLSSITAKNTGYICKAYCEGTPVKEIAKDIGCSEPLIYRILHENNVPMRPRGKGNKGNKGRTRSGIWEKASFICESYQKGVPVKKIANQLGCGIALIYKILHENNVSVSKTNEVWKGKKQSVEHRKKNSEAQLGMSQEQLIFLIQWYSGWGWSQRRIARELGKGQKTISKYAKLAK